MIVGIGNDILEIERIEKACKNEYFIKRIFSEMEIEQAKGRSSFFAGNFSAKESISKAFGTGIRDFDLKEIEILRDENGKPYTNLTGRAKSLAQRLEIKKIFVSISDTNTLVMTTAVVET